MTGIKQDPPHTGFEVAVIGMSGRFPGAGNIHEFWENLKNGIESVTFFSREELEAAGVGPELLDDPDYVPAGGGVLENKGCFDAYFFDFLPREAEVMDPQHRVLHECAWAALEDAGYITGDNRYSIGMFAGASPNFHWEALALISGKYGELGAFAASHLIDRGCLSTRISYLFNLKGPGVTVQTTCSTSLVAIHMACRAILGGECDMALAGGAAVKSVPDTGYLYREGMILSRDGHCRAFDNEADGTVAGEGVGIVVLKALEEAINDRDHIYAVIKSTAVNNDGSAKVGYSAPAVDGQAAVIRAALHMAEVEPGSITYIETHGTGTALGDPVEIEALKLAYGSDDVSLVKGQYCGIGSVKTNIGHLDAAAGIAGFIKTVLSLIHRQLPPSLNFKSPNGKIDFENSPFYVVERLLPWKNNRYPLRAGVSAFGIGGTNAHAVLEESPQYEACSVESKHQLFLLSARTSSALDKMTSNLVSYLENNGSGLELTDITYTLQIGRKAFEHRKMTVCSDVAEAVEALSSPDLRKVRYSLIKDGKKPAVFMFPGLGPQYVGMGMELYRGESMFREEMDQCFELLAPLMGKDPKEILWGDRFYTEAFNRPEIAQPMLFIIEYALARLLIRWGIRPYAMIGYSFGEYTAACISGVFSLEDALKLVVNRGKLISRVQGGAMLSVPLTAAELIPLLGKELTVAIDNGLSCIAAGPIEAIEAFEKRINEKKIICMRIQGAHAIHSKMMDPILGAFKESLAHISLNEPSIPYISNVTGYWLSAEDARNPQYWIRHLRDTVLFAAGIRELRTIQNAVYVEVGPGRTLSTLIRQFFEKENQPAAINLLKQSNEVVHDHRYFLDKIGQLWLNGMVVDWNAVYQDEQRRRLALPTYPFEGRRYWLDIDLSSISGKTLFEKPVSRAGNAGEAGSVRPAVPVPSIGLETRERHPALTSPYEPPRDDLERELIRIWQDFFGLTPVGIRDDFFELGGDSLKAMALLSKIRKEMAVEIKLTEFFDHSTVKGLGQLNLAERRGTDDFCFIEKTEKMEYYPVSPAQERLYVLQQGTPNSVAYNMPGIFNVEGNFDCDRANAAFKMLIERHESFRTTFHLLGDRPIQVIHSFGDVGFEIEYMDITGTPEMKEAVLGRFIRPFDLSMLPLVRVGVMRIEEKRFILTVDMHHTISDGISALIVGREFVPLYRGEILPEFRLQYKDYSQWQNQRIRDGEMKKQEAFWLKEFEGKIPELSLPMDFQRPGNVDAGGSSVEFMLGKEETLKLKRVAKEENVTMFALFLSIYNTLLYKLTGQEDIVIGTVTAGRRHADLEGLIGMFVNTLALRNYPCGDKLFTDLLKEVKRRSLKAFDNQDYQFGDLVDRLQVHREPGRQPLFDALFTFGGDTRTKYDSELVDPQDMEIDVEPGLKIKAYDASEQRSMFDLVLGCFDFVTALQINFHFSRALFKESTIERFVKYLKEIICAVTDNKSIRLKDIKVSLELEELKADVYSSVESDFEF
jgi:phthiocerol/phenolphthiocerol synthesis type-I polyketide synthase E